MATREQERNWVLPVSVTQAAFGWERQQFEHLVDSVLRMAREALLREYDSRRAS